MSPEYTLSKIKELCEKKIEFYDHGMESLEVYSLATSILGIIASTDYKKGSIRRYSTEGMDLQSREELYNLVSPIPIGEWVYRSGDAWSYTDYIQVTEENQKTVTMFWNSLYFDNEKDADIVTCRAHAEYNDYQARAAEGMMEVYNDGRA